MAGYQWGSHAAHGMWGKAAHRQGGERAKNLKAKAEKSELKGTVKAKGVEATLAALDRQRAELKKIENWTKARLTALEKRQEAVRASLENAEKAEKNPAEKTPEEKK